MRNIINLNANWKFIREDAGLPAAYPAEWTDVNLPHTWNKEDTVDGDGSYSLPEDGSADGYWKLLIDFKMYDNDGVGSPQMPVMPNFNMEEAQRVLDEYEGGADTLPVAQDVVDRYVNEFDGMHHRIARAHAGCKHLLRFLYALQTHLPCSYDCMHCKCSFQPSLPLTAAM